MPETQIIFFQDDRGEVPVLNWLKKLLKQDRKGYANCIARIEQLAEYGFELKRPAADFFHGQNVVILAHAMIKEHKQVPEKEIELALKYKNLFVLKPENYTYTEPEEEANEEN